MEPVFPQAMPHEAELSPHERQRRELMLTLQIYGSKPVAELSDMTEGERCKWLFWNLHENLDGIRMMEPTLQARVSSMQFTVLDGSKLIGDGAMEKRLDLSCQWTLTLTYPGFPEEMMHALGDGWVNLIIAEQAPSYLTVEDGQKAYLDADHSIYPNQLYLEGWITNGVWQEMRQPLSNVHPGSRTDVVLLDNVLFPVRQGFDFVTGPPGSIGVVNMEFRVFSHPAERRMSRRGETQHRS